MYMNRRLRFRNTVLIIAILLCYICTFVVPYFQTFGRGYEFRNHFYANFFASYAYLGRPDRYLTLDGRLLKNHTSVGHAEPATITRAICRIPLTKSNFDDLFKGASWTHYGVDAKWLRENCKAAWIGLQLEGDRVAMHYILKLKNGDIVVCSGTLFSWNSKTVPFLGFAEYYSPNGSVTDFYRLIEDSNALKN